MKVTAILPTRGRPEMALRALGCIVTQQWRDLEILVLDDLNNPSFPDGLSVKFIDYYRWDEASLGSKLKLACTVATGEYIVHFHDDDYSAPIRVADQVARLEASGKAVTTYRNLRYTDGRRIWINHNWPGGFGTSLCHRRDWSDYHSFPSCESEDWEFVAAAMRANQHIAGEAGDTMLVRITHNANVGANWEEIAC